MNGRIYDPTLGRFLQADPHIQAPKNSQNFNRYSYVLNNPMSYTDPSGYFFKALGKFVKKHWRTIASIAISVYLPGAGGLLQGWGVTNIVAQGAITGFIAGGVATGSLKGALVGAFSGAMFGQLHSMTQGVGKVIAHGMAGGLSSVLNGGKFGHGFMSAGFTQTMGNVKGMFVDGATRIADRISNAVKAAMIGGTASAISGGKFANGAVTGAFSRLLNDDAASRRPQTTKVVVGVGDKKYGLDAITREQACGGYSGCEATLASTPGHIKMARVGGNLFVDTTSAEYQALSNAIKVDFADYVSNTANVVTVIVPALAGPAQVIGTLADGVKLIYADNPNAVMIDIMAGKAIGGAFRGGAEMGYDASGNVISDYVKERVSSMGELLYEGTK
jgi:hypothetical protein